MASAAERLLAWWAALAARWNPVLVMVAVWAVLVLPLMWFRGFNSDEGVAVMLARAALEDGDWLAPRLVGYRFTERPVLLSWVVALISLPFGSVSQFTARLPIVLSVLGGCLLIFRLLRGVASRPAALFGVALFLACPLVLRAYVMATADLPLAVLLFLAFCLWWAGFETRRLTIPRWIGIGGVLAVAALLKGPQPLGFFFLGVGAFIAMTRAWGQIPGLLLAGVVAAVPVGAWYALVYAPGDETTWAMFMRLDRSRAADLLQPLRAAANSFFEMLPASLLTALFLLVGRGRAAAPPPPGFIAAIACYAFTCAAVLLFWPGGEAARYFLPMAPAFCVFGGLAYDGLSVRRPAWIAAALLVTLGILGYAAAYSAIASPFLPARFRSAKIDASRIAERIRAAPAPIYSAGPGTLNEFSYLPMRVIGMNMQSLQTLRGPAWIVASAEEADALLAKRPSAFRVALAFGRPERWRLLHLDE